MNNREKAVGKFKEGFNCAQSVLFSLSESTGISEDLSLKIATGFGAGMGRKQHVCGAVSGGIVALNLLYGRGSDDGKEKQEESYGKVRQLIERFEDENSTVICRDLIDGCDLLSEAGQERFRAENMMELCHKYISSAVKIVEEIIEES